MKGLEDELDFHAKNRTRIGREFSDTENGIYAPLQQVRREDEHTARVPKRRYFETAHVCSMTGAQYILPLYLWLERATSCAPSSSVKMGGGTRPIREASA